MSEKKPPRDWCWKRLAANEVKPRYDTSGVRRPEYQKNARGVTVKITKEKDRRPAVERFFDYIEYLGECWKYKQGEDQIWVNDKVIISPWRFSYEIHNGVLAPKHARFTWTCKTPKCCNPEHLFLTRNS